MYQAILFLEFFKMCSILLSKLLK